MVLIAYQILMQIRFVLYVFIFVDTKAAGTIPRWIKNAKLVLGLLSNALRKLQPLVKLAWRFRHEVRL